MKIELTSTVGQVVVDSVDEATGEMKLTVKPAEKFELSSSGKSYIGAYGADNLVIKGEKFRLAVTLTNDIPKLARSENAAKTKNSPFPDASRLRRVA